MAPGKLDAAEKWAQRNPPSPTETRDAVLGWVGFLVIAGLVWLIFSDGPSDRQQRAAEGFGPLARVEEYAGGSKAFECDLLAAAYNYFLTDEFIAALAEIEWQSPENVSLIIEPQEGGHIRWHPA